MTYLHNELLQNELIRLCLLITAYFLSMCIGKLHNGVNTAAELVDFPNQTKIVDLAAAASYTLALAKNGDVYYWGKCKVFVQCLMGTGPVLSQLWSCTFQSGRQHSNLTF